MAKKFMDKVAIVTASTQGIGFAIAKRLCEDGAKVVISSRKQVNVDNALQRLSGFGLGSQAHGVTCHVGNSQDRVKLIDSTIDKFGRLDILVNNAGINPTFGDLLDVDENVWNKLFAGNVTAGFELSKICVPHIEKAGGGSIVFVSSVGGYVPLPAISAYGVTKTTLLGLTKALSLSCAQRKIRVNCIAPGIIKTDFSRALWETAESNPDSNMTQNLIPLGRFGTAQDCAGAVAFLCSEDAAYITGETICITGGMSARL